jgi:hypothetical protein
MAKRNPDFLHLFGNLALWPAEDLRQFWGGKKGAAFFLVQLTDHTLSAYRLNDEVDRSLQLRESFDNVDRRYVTIEDPRDGELINAAIYVQGAANNWRVSTYDPATGAIFYQQDQREGSPGRAVASFIEEQAQLFNFPLGY